MLTTWWVMALSCRLLASYFYVLIAWEPAICAAAVDWIQSAGCLVAGCPVAGRWQLAAGYIHWTYLFQTMYVLRCCLLVCIFFIHAKASAQTSRFRLVEILLWYIGARVDHDIRRHHTRLWIFPDSHKNWLHWDRLSAELAKGLHTLTPVQPVCEATESVFFSLVSLTVILKSVVQLDCPSVTSWAYAGIFDGEVRF